MLSVRDFSNYNQRLAESPFLTQTAKNFCNDREKWGQTSGCYKKEKVGATAFIFEM